MTKEDVSGRGNNISKGKEEKKTTGPQEKPERLLCQEYTHTELTIQGLGGQLSTAVLKVST